MNSRSGQKESAPPTEADVLAMALAPFASYFAAMEAYSVFHSGKFPPDAKVMAYTQTEMGHSAGITVGDFRRALRAMNAFTRKYGGENAIPEVRKMAEFDRALSFPKRSEPASVSGSPTQPRKRA